MIIFSRIRDELPGFVSFIMSLFSQFMKMDLNHGVEFVSDAEMRKFLLLLLRIMRQ